MNILINSCSNLNRCTYNLYNQIKNYSSLSYERIERFRITHSGFDGIPALIIGTATFPLQECILKRAGMFTAQLLGQNNSIIPSSLSLLALNVACLIIAKKKISGSIFAAGFLTGLTCGSLFVIEGYTSRSNPGIYLASIIPHGIVAYAAFYNQANLNIQLSNRIRYPYPVAPRISKPGRIG